MPNKGAGSEAGASSSSSAACEPLACVSCRTRKLKCDRVKPVCTRCAKAKAECAYPESRRKPSFKRRNVKELEARLAQVEDMLKDAKEAGKLSADEMDGVVDGGGLADLDSHDWVGDFDFNESLMNSLAEGTVPFANPPLSRQPATFPTPSEAALGLDDSPVADLIGLGQLESLPPFELIEELHKIYFEKQHHFIPIVHPGRYLQAFHSAPHLRPPMCLQYAIWTLACHGHDEYSSYHDIFYQRTRKYLEVDEMKDFGQHFITVGHAQAWALVATDEARCMLFTRSGMSSARCIRLVEMMGLHRMDNPSPEIELPEVLPPPQNWTELEERRRLFWGCFCIDSHASISTGWPNLINNTTITTHLPSSEEAFVEGKEEATSTLAEVFGGSRYSTFASAIIICHIFNRLLQHIHFPMPSDRPEDFEYGDFWKRHRDLDNTLSSAFMFLPEQFRLPKYVRNPVAVHTNLNLHASVICLHFAACEKADKHNLSVSVKKVSMDRLLTAAGEIVNIMKLTSHMTSSYRSPLAALSLYLAGSVYIYQAKETRDPTGIDNLEFMIKCMEAIGRDHIITRAFLQQAVLDIDCHNTPVTMQLPFRDKTTLAPVGNCIPLLARTSISRHSRMTTPLPGRLPLAHPTGSAYPANPWHPDAPRLSDTGERVTISVDMIGGGTHKRRRVVSPEPSSGSSVRAPDDHDPGVLWFQPADRVTSAGPTAAAGPVAAAPSSGPATNPTSAYVGPSQQTRLPHRPQSPATSASGGRPTPSTQVSTPGALGLSAAVAATSTAATTLDEILAGATSTAATVTTVGGTDAEAGVPIAAMEFFNEQLNHWDLGDPQSLFMHVESVLRHDAGSGQGDPWMAAMRAADAGEGASRERREGSGRGRGN